MRYREIIEAQSVADKMSKESQKRLKANQKIDNARRKRSDAATKYQDSLRSANQAEQAAKAKLNPSH